MTSSTVISNLRIELSHQAAEVFRSLPEREARRVAAALEGLKRARQRTEAPTGDDAERFLESRAGRLCVFYRIEKQALKVALLRFRNQARVREFPISPD